MQSVEFRTHEPFTSQVPALNSSVTPPEQEGACPVSQPAPVVIVWVQPPIGLQASVVHTLLSSQSSAAVPGTHAPPEQMSPTVHASPSLHPVPLGAFGFEHTPVFVSHVPIWWHWSSAAHTTALPEWHVPPWHVSPTVHAFPSLHPVPFPFAVQPVWLLVGVHTWHGLLGFGVPLP